MSRFKYCIIGGTFDRLHNGHLSLIKFAFEISENVTIQITTDSFVKDKILAKKILPYQARKKEIEELIKNNKLALRSKIFPLSNFCGTAINDPLLEAIVVTKETKNNALKINKTRKVKGLNPLKIIVIPLIKSLDNKIIRSSRIRLGVIDRKGMVYSHVFKTHKNLILPESLRETLKKPFGFLIKGKKSNLKPVAEKAIQLIKSLDPSVVVVVGDIIAASLEKIGYKADLKVIDFKSERVLLENLSRDKKQQYFNKPGTINYKTVQKFKIQMKKLMEKKEKTSMIIKGEEDLLALPAILFAPLGSVVIYGLRNIGIVVVEVTEDVKEKTKKIVHSFKSIK